MKDVKIYTDGSCLNNTGYGGWACLLVFDNIQKGYCGHAKKITTNSRMELLAVIKGLSKLKEPCNVTVYSDSSYIVNAIQKNWLKKWQKNYWKASNKKPVQNKDLWEKLVVLMDKHNVTFKKVKAHAGIPLNELVDTKAREQAELAKSKLIQIS